MQGKLVEQNAEDQPAKELLQEINAEKEKLIIEGQIKKQKPLPDIKSIELPFNIPDNWSWERLGNLVSKLGSGSTPKGGKNAYVEQGIMFFRSQNIYNDGIRTDNISFISEDIHQKMISTQIYPEDVLFNITGGSLGRSALVPLDFEEGNISQHVCIIRPIKILARFMHLVTIGSYFQRFIPKSVTGSGREGLQKNKMELFPIAIPPLAEQKRIVEKIDQLMALCDELEAQRNARDEKRLAVHSSAINRLVNADSKESFNSSWQFITNHFNDLYSVKENVAELKKAVLTLAMQGKLVEQDPEDQPAKELLEEIKAEKEKLIAEGKIKKQKPLPPIKQDEIPYEIPDSWEWVRFEAAFIFEYGNNLPAKKRSNTGEYPVYGSNGIVGTHNIPFVKGSCIVIGRKGSAGALNLCLADGCCITDVAYYCQPTKHIDLLFAFNLFKNLNFELMGKGIKPGLNRNEVYNRIIPLPPLAEQKRIVEKIDELMALCDTLENQIKQATAKQTVLFDAVLVKV